MTIIYSLFLGTIQGITEFLPISSSAHLVIIPLFLKYGYQGLNFDVALHVGTLLALIFYFFKDWKKLIISGFSKYSSKEKRLFWNIALASIPAAVAGLLLNEIAETALRNPVIISFALILGGLILFIADKKAKTNKDIFELSSLTSFFIGIAQAIAIIPGVSRSGITIAAGLLIGLKRESAAKFSFLLALPIILGAGLLTATKLTINELDASFFMGILSSTIASIITIRFFLNYLKKANLNLFVYYRIALGIALILLAILKII